MADVCMYCAQELHFQCRDEDTCCCEERVPELLDSLNLAESKQEPTEKNPVGRPIKTDGFKDLLSAGRKRAAKLYAIQPGQICEWAWHKQCGGGISPIIGCSGRPATNIHHGPDKSVLNNRPDNVSVVCSHCHNKWHADNDKTYPNLYLENPDAYDVTGRPLDGSPWLPVGDKVYALSDKEEATKEEILEFERVMGRDLPGSDAQH